jgi:hypothetical protein
MRPKIQTATQLEVAIGAARNWQRSSPQAKALYRTGAARSFDGLIGRDDHGSQCNRDRLHLHL